LILIAVSIFSPASAANAPKPLVIAHPPMSTAPNPTGGGGIYGPGIGPTNAPNLTTGSAVRPLLAPSPNGISGTNGPGNNCNTNQAVIQQPDCVQ
jgi:hypothetical protein